MSGAWSRLSFKAQETQASLEPWAPRSPGQARAPTAGPVAGECHPEDVVTGSLHLPATLPVTKKSRLGFPPPHPPAPQPLLLPPLLGRPPGAGLSLPGGPQSPSAPTSPPTLGLGHLPILQSSTAATSSRGLPGPWAGLCPTHTSHLPSPSPDPGSYLCSFLDPIANICGTQGSCQNINLSESPSLQDKIILK